MSLCGLTRPRPNRCHQTLLTAARAKYGFSVAVIHLASTGRYGSPLARSGCPPVRKPGGTILAPNGSLSFLPLPAVSVTLMMLPFLAAFLGFAEMLTLVKN